MAEQYHSRKVKGAYLFQLSALTVLSTAVQLLAGGKIMASITELPFPLMAILLAAIAFSYAQFSGIRASVLTDAVQMIFILLACIVFVPWALSGDGTANLIQGLAGNSGDYDSLFSGKGFEVFLSFGLPTAVGLISGPFGDQCFWQRAFSIRRNKIGRAFLIGAALFAAVPLSMGILGFIAAGAGFVPTDTAVVNLELITYLFPPWAVLPFLFMLISGLLSTVDSNLCAAASLTTDITRSQSMKIPRAAMVALLAAGIAIANIPGLSVTHLFLIYGTLRASTLLPTVFTLLNAKLSARGIVTGILVSLCVGLPIFAYGTLCGDSLFKTLGSLFTVLSSGILAAIITRLEVLHARKKAVHQE